MSLNTEMDNPQKSSNNNSELLNSTISLLEKAESEITLNEKFRNLVLILADESLDISLFQWITEVNMNKTVTESEAINEEGQQIGDFAYNFQKGCPGLPTTIESNVFYYGCSCFSDVRNTKVDIVTTYFTNKVLNHAERIKIVFIVNYSSLKKTARREEFIKFLRHSSYFMKDIDKFKGSVAMIANEVDEQYVINGSNFVLVDDSQTVNDIADFMLKTKQHITDKQNETLVGDTERKFNENAIKFIDVILEKDNERYKKLGIFRKEIQHESYSNISMLEVIKVKIQKMLCEDLIFAENRYNEFECTISENSKLDIKKLEEEINNIIWLSIRNVSENLYEYFKNQIQKIIHKLEYIDKGGLIVEADPVEAVNLSFKFKNYYYTILNLIDALHNSTKVKELVKGIKDVVSTLDITVADFEIANIERFAKYIDILQVVSKKEFGKRPWKDLFSDVLIYISESRKNIQNAIDIAVKKVKHRIQLNLSYISKKMKQKYNEKLKTMFTVKTMEIEKLYERFSNEYENILKLTEDIKHLRTIESLVKKLQGITKIPGITSSKRHIANIANEGKYFMFLHFLSDTILDNGSSSWPKGFKEVTDFLQESEKWYKFLSDLYIKCSEYSTQMERKKYVDFLERREESDIFHETSITPINFAIFLEKIRNLEIAEHENVVDIVLTESRLKELNDLVNLTLKHNITIECSDTHMFVKGEYVSLEEVRHLRLTNDDKKCKQFFYQKTHRKFVNIFSLNTLFIDRDVNLQGDCIQLIYISPKWEIIGNRTINLNGSDGTRYIQTRANDGRYPGGDGDHGEPGEPGGPGEIFFGIGGTFVNGANLTISANGGDGSSGQDGGNGREGIAGDSVKLPDQDRGLYSSDCCQYKSVEDLSEEKHRASSTPEKVTFHDVLLAMEATARRDFLQKVKQQTKNGFGCERSTNIPRKDNVFFQGFSRIDIFEEHYKLLGKTGKKGGNGGNGGKGGLGGNPGSVTIAELGSQSGIKKYSDIGKVGDMGKGGWGANGGKDGEDAYAMCIVESRRHPSILPPKKSIRWSLLGYLTHDRKGISGRHGRNGSNSVNIKNVAPAKLIHEPSEIFNKYKRYLRESLTNDVRKIPLMKFYEQINKNDIVRENYDTDGLVGEFIDLEDQFYLLKKGVDFYPFHTSLLERTDEYLKGSVEKHNTSRDQKIVFSYLYAAILSKIRSLKESSENDLVIDIETYLNTIKNEIKILQDLEKSNSKAKAIDDMKKEYKKRIDDKIKEAKFFIENTVDPEINRISNEIDIKIDQLINETIALQNKAQNEKYELERKKEELQKALQLRKVFDFFKVLGRVISLLGPYGMAIGAAIELGTSVGESLALDSKLKPQDLSSAASKLNSVENNIKMMRIEKTDYLNNVLTELSHETMQHPEELGGISTKVADMRSRLSDVRTHKRQYKEVKNIERDLKETLKTKEVDLIFQGKKKSRNVSKVLKRFGQAVEVGSTFVEIYQRNKEDDERIAAINDAIQQKENEIRVLREYEEQIYETINPALQNMKSNLQVFANELNKRSQVALDVGKWQVQSALKDMQIQMRRVTEGMQVKDDLVRCIEKLEEAMSILITIYDRIQQYQDEQILSNYIANVCSVNTSTLPITNQNLVNVTNHLEWSIRANLVLKRYETALNAFKQWVFPFSAHYLDESMTPTHFQLDKNIQNLVFKASKQIENLELKLQLYKSTARDTDEILTRGNFNSRCRTCSPFFEWENEQYGNEISRLLSGKTTILKANVRFSEFGKDAIKFNLIKLNFKLKNESLQSSLEETMELFDISATHTGNSYYRYREEMYVITNPKREIFYSFEEDSKTGDPVRDSEANVKIKEAVPMLSPYTTWIFKLNATSKNAFRQLDIYKGQIDLELEGKGNFVRTGSEPEDDEYEIENQLETLAESELKYRTVRSLGESQKAKMYATSGSDSNLSSPINYLCNLLKMFSLSMLTIPYKKIFEYSSKESNSDNIVKNSQMTSKKSVENIFSNKIKEKDMLSLLTSLIEKCSDKTDENAFSSKDSDSTRSVSIYNFNPNPNTIKCNNNFKRQTRPFILSTQENESCSQNIQVPNLSCNLMLADLISRSFTGIKYKSEISESLTSPKHAIFKKCNEILMKSDDDFTRNLCLFSDSNKSMKKSWFSSVKNKIKLVFQSLGFINKEDSDEYIHDIKHLFKTDEV